MPPFHLAFPVHDLDAARAFYGDLLGCPEGRSSTHWIDFNFFGHQIVAHLAPDECAIKACMVSEVEPQGEPQAHPSTPLRMRGQTSNNVDNHQVPVRHFGLVLDMPIWRKLADRLDGKVDFIIAPYIRFKSEAGEQATMFFADPSGNAIELKAFADMGRLFAK